MTSTFAVSLTDRDHDYDHQHDPGNDQYPFMPPYDSDTASPHSFKPLETPGASTSGLSHHNPSDISDVGEDPFFGADFSNPDGGVPSFFEDEHAGWNTSAFAANNNTSASVSRRNVADSCCPLTPEHTASIHTNSPGQRLPDSISPQELQKPFRPNPIITQATQMTPCQSSSGRSSEDSLAPVASSMHHITSPRVTVSVWDQDDNVRTHTVERSLEDSPTTLRGGFQSAGDLISSSYSEHQSTSISRDSTGRWQRDPFTGQAGLDPLTRSSDKGPSINEISNRQKTAERNEDVDRWIHGAQNLHDISAAEERSAQESLEIEQSRSDGDDDIPLGDNTENRLKDDQIYYGGNGGQMNDQDYEIIAQHKWASPPMLPTIQNSTPGRNQPQSSQAAIERFERMCRDTDSNSLLSRSATWGTRRRSIHSVSDLDMDNILSGNFLKKLSINRGGDHGGDRGNKVGSLLKDLRNIVRRPSISSLRKRRVSGSGEDLHEHVERPSLENRDSIGSPLLAPPEGTSSWGKKNTPSLNTALASLADNFVHMNTPAGHSRKSSIGASSMTSPRGLSVPKVNNTLKRQRSRSEAPNPNSIADSALVGMWKRSGGPPVAVLTKPSPSVNVEIEEDDDEDDDIYEENDLKMDANLIDSVEANLAGFQSHILLLNPRLEGRYDYLVERIAHHQVSRYKALLSLKVKHLKQGANCPCGSLCMTLGGQANILDQKGDGKSVDPLASHYIDDDDAGTPTDGAINQDSFPQDIPLPPTQYLPAEFECQLCYSSKKFQKPSDWTKHVHEDVQPFTCTWDRCRDPKSFKRKADWVRHENEGHRHLEWWTCDVEECRHVCYRRDNFLQHLVREHKYPEPKFKSKAAVKKAGGIDPTLQKVEQCHVLTSQRPQEEPCRFCDRVFPTWKKLTVHLAKHMENISLPVLRLVAAKAKEISEDTIISPVEDLPQRPMLPLPMNQNPANGPFGNGHQAFVPSQGQIRYQNPAGYMYPVAPQGGELYTGHYDSLGHTLGVDTMNHGFDQTGQMQNLPVAQPISSYGQGQGQFITLPSSSNNNDNDLEPFPSLDPLGLHNHLTGQMGAQTVYNSMVDQSTVSASPFSGHGSASPYIHSPHMHATAPDNGWDDRRMSGFR